MHVGLCGGLVSQYVLALPFKTLATLLSPGLLTSVSSIAAPCDSKSSAICRVHRLRTIRSKLRALAQMPIKLNLISWLVYVPSAQGQAAGIRHLSCKRIGVGVCMYACQSEAESPRIFAPFACPTLRM